MEESKRFHALLGPLVELFFSLDFNLCAFNSDNDSNSVAGEDHP